MKIQKQDSEQERRVLAGMVLDDAVCAAVAGRWREDGLFRGRWANVAAGWCVDYWRKYGEAPRAHIEGLFAAWADRATDRDTVDLVDEFLQGLSDEYEDAGGLNASYIIDVAGNLFNAVLLERMADVVRGHVERGDTDKAIAAVAAWNKVEIGAGAGIDILHDQEAIRNAFEQQAEPLVVYPGDLGRFFGDQLSRDQFIGITGATGRGKTWWLMDIAWMAVLQHRRVALFECGDMSESQIIQRIMCRAAALPVKEPLDVEYPTAITRAHDMRMAAVETEMRTFGQVLGWREAWAACQRMTRRHKQPLLRLSVHANDSINVAGIEGILDVWERDGWVPDVVIVDYADILAAPVGYPPGEREAINATWKRLRRISQTRHCLVVTGTQGDAASYDAHTLRRSNFSDDRRKNDHVTAMLCINATEEEQVAGIQRLNWTKRRGDAYRESTCVHVAGCLALGKPHVKSTF